MLLRRTFAGVRRDIRVRRRAEPEGLIPAFDRTLPTATAHYGNGPTTVAGKRRRFPFTSRRIGPSDPG